MKTQPASPDPTPITAEEGETMGTLAQFARDLAVTPSALLRCAESHEQAIVLSGQVSGQILLILDPETLRTIPQCARGSKAAAGTS